MHSFVNASFCRFCCSLNAILPWHHQIVSQSPCPETSVSAGRLPWLTVLCETLLLSADELAGLVILVEGEDLALSADWKKKAVNRNRWLKHCP